MHLGGKRILIEWEVKRQRAAMKKNKKKRDGRNVKKASNKKIHKIRDDDGS